LFCSVTCHVHLIYADKNFTIFQFLPKPYQFKPTWCFLKRLLSQLILVKETFDTML
jgi:hypothetical protein